jgi:adenine-specific DNA glycosylase
LNKEVPDTMEGLLKLPGVGSNQPRSYTSTHTYPSNLLLLLSNIALCHHLTLPLLISSASSPDLSQYTHTHTNTHTHTHTHIHTPTHTHTHTHTHTQKHTCLRKDAYVTSPLRPKMAIIVLNIAFDKQVGVSIDTHLVLFIVYLLTNTR